MIEYSFFVTKDHCQAILHLNGVVYVGKGKTKLEAYEHLVQQVQAQFDVLALWLTRTRFSSNNPS